MIKTNLLSGAIGGAILASAVGSSATAAEYDGIKVNILTRPGPVIAQRLVERAEEFTAMTGAKIRVTPKTLVVILSGRCTKRRWASLTRIREVL